MGFGSALNMYRICGRTDILNAANLSSQDNSFLAMTLSWVSSLANKGLMLVLANDSMELVRVIPRYGMPFLLQV